MRKYTLLSEENVQRRRTVADALNVLEAAIGAWDSMGARIEVGPLRLPAGKLVGLVSVIYDVIGGNESYVVRLPTATQFTAFREASQVRERFGVFELAGASILNA